jgi:phosphate starvation-inducible protein PhoH
MRDFFAMPTLTLRQMKMFLERSSFGVKAILGGLGFS